MIRLVVIVAALIILAIATAPYVNGLLKDTDYSWIGGDCGFHFINKPHNDRTCIPPLSCVGSIPDAGGTCGI